MAGRLDRLEDNYAQLLALLTKPPLAGNEASSSPQRSLPTNPSISTPSTLTHSDIYSVEGLGPSLEAFDLEASLPTYRQMSAEYYPYVIVPEECSASWLARHRPLLALAIGVVTTAKNPNLQSHLRDLFLKELSVRYFSRYERSLDLMQAVLVYFGW